MRTLGSLVVLLAAIAASGAVHAVTCYTLLDGKDGIVYQSSLAPVDLGDQAARDGLRRRHEYLLISDFDSCPSVAPSPGTTGYRPASVDEIVGQMRGYLTYGGGPGNVGFGADVGPSGGGGDGNIPSPAASPGASPGRARGY